MDQSLTSIREVPSGEKHYSLGIISIATNEYINYWKKLAQSIDKHYVGNKELQLILFTDDPVNARNFSNKLSTPVIVFEIPSYGWPEATLLRFQIIESRKSFLTHRTLMYLDADSLLNFKFTSTDFSLGNEDQMTFVEHPGYWRPKNKILFYYKNPLIGLKDLLRITRMGGNGTWEKNRISSAFVPRCQRDKYFCGGVWFGPNREFLRFCSELSLRVKDDLEKPYIAKWHDESHLNKWVTINQINHVGPEYCYATEFPHLSGLRNLITAVQKT